MKAKLISLLLIFYSALFTLLIPLLKFAARFSPRFKSQIAGRPSIADTSAKLHENRKRFKHGALFFCSSAGEFEQARPLMDRLSSRGDTFVHALIFSRSGFDYARARAERCSYSLAPVSDSVWHWGWILSAMRPSLITVVRHELWPGFMGAAKNYAPVYLIDASASLGEQRSFLKRLVRSTLFQMFERIFVVSDGDRDYFRSEYGVGKDRIIVAGDTKYDRVLERAKLSTEKEPDQPLFVGSAPGRLILGSAHKPDLMIFTEAVKKSPAILADWQVVIAPHHIDEDNLASFRSELNAVGVEVARWSQGRIADKGAVVLLDTMGMLAEAYSQATAAFVGGASHYQVHNVLEPAVHGLALAWGPHYKNSQEAAYLVGQGAAHVVNNAEEFTAWLGVTKNSRATGDNQTAVTVRSLCGASDRIIDEWKSVLNG